MSIPALWRIASESTEPEKDLILELWVFWFDERHTGKIDANDDLYTLDGKFRPKISVLSRLIFVINTCRSKSRLIYLGKRILENTITHSIACCLNNTVKYEYSCHSL
jgi:hypothetical protein